MRCILSSISVSLLIILSFFLYIPQIHAAVLSGWGTATMDGVVNPSEWAGAATINFGGGPQTITGTFYIMNDATNLYMAAIINGDDDLDSNDEFFIYFDNDNGGEGYLEAGDDFLLLSGGGGIFTDLHKLAIPGWNLDTGAGGANDGSGAVSRIGSSNHFEMSHPLNSGDTGHDFSLSAGQLVGFTFLFRIDYDEIIHRLGDDLEDPSTWSDDYQISGGRYPNPPSSVVGGITLPSNRLSILAPYLVLAVMLGLALRVLNRRT